MGRQFRHDSSSIGDPCGRCGLVYSRETAYVPCFEEGDTFETWKAKQPEEIRLMLKPPPSGTAKPRNIFVPDGRYSALDDMKKSVVQSMLQLVQPPIRQRQEFGAIETVTRLSALIVAHIEDAMWALPSNEDLEELVSDRDRLAARVEELEAEIVRLRGASPGGEQP